jgi:two-component system nitrogen regulation response regulator GlnG
MLVPALTLVSHPSPERVGERLLLEALVAGQEVSLSRGEPHFVRPGTALGSPLADRFLSRGKPLVFSPGPEGGIRLDPGSGSQVTVAGKPLEGPWELSAAEVATGVSLTLAGRVGLVLHLAAPQVPREADTLGLVGTSVGIQRVRQFVEQVADLNVPVLVLGESGSDKGLIARAIHERSPRRERPFVSVNLGTIPRELAAAKLFGVREGDLTGAVRDPRGFFQAAHGGTLFLNEVSEAPPEVQVLLRRVLETGEIYPVGERTPLAVDVRLVAATDASLEALILEDELQAPLLHRLSGYVIRVPPLRERREDIGLLFHHFARQKLEMVGKASRLDPRPPDAEPWLPAALACLLVRYDWPGNHRQLRHVTSHLLLDNWKQPCLRLDAGLEQALALPEAPSAGHPVTAPSPPPARAMSLPEPSDVSEDELLAALRDSVREYEAAAYRPVIHDKDRTRHELFELRSILHSVWAYSEEAMIRYHRECQGDLDEMAQRLEVSKQALRQRLVALGLGSTKA